MLFIDARTHIYPKKFTLKIVPRKRSDTTCDVPNTNIQRINHRYQSDILQKEIELHTQWIL
jgi:hypothetical protein